MAVSMNSGFMRSDYMISDAAIPLRMEELEQLEQTAKFAEILGGIGGTPTGEAQQMAAETSNDAVMTDADIPAEEMTLATENSVVLSKSELKALARSVVNGEIKLEDIPPEMRTDILMMVIAMMMAGIPEDEIPALQGASEIDGVSTATAEVVQNVIAKLENASDKTTELNELLNGFVSAQDETAVVPQEEAGVFEEAVTQLLSAEAQPAQDGAENAQRATVNAQPIQDVGEQTAETELSVMSDKGAQQLSDAEHIPSEAAEVQAQTAVSVQDTVSDKQTELQQTAAVEVVTAQTIVEPQSAQQEGAAQGNAQGFAQGAPVQTSATENTSAAQTEFEQLRNVISEVHVTKEPQSQQTERQSFTAVQDIRTGESAKGRVVSKSDELMMLKNAAKPTEAMQAVIPQGIEQPVVIYTRTDGTQLEVKPEEVLKQVADNIIQQAATTNTEGETEYSVTLNPEDLGSITVRMTKTVDGTFNVSITAENARTQRIIEESGMAIQNSLRQNGIELESWQTVNESEQQERAEDYNGSSKNPYYREEQSENEDAEDTTFAELISAM